MKHISQDILLVALLLVQHLPAICAFSANPISRNEATTSPPLPSRQEDVVPLAENDQQQQQQESKAQSSFPPAAVILNANARQVTPDLLPLAQLVFGEESVYWTQSEQDARDVARKLVQQNTTLVIPVGGDGTLTTFLNLLSDAVLETSPIPDLTSEQVIEKLPMIGYIPYGTGNGAGSVIGCSAPPVVPKSKRQRLKNALLSLVQRKKSRRDSLARTFENLRQVSERARQLQLEGIGQCELGEKLDCDLVSLSLMQVTSDQAKVNGESLSDLKGDMAFFAGVGFDSLILQDFKDIQDWTKKQRNLSSFIKESLSSVAGYCVALVTLTLPKCVQHQAHEVSVRISTTTPDHTLWIDHRRGDVARAVATAKTGEATLLYNGTAGIVAAGTSPFYGGGLRLFPFSCLHPDKLHLRVGRIHPLRGFVNIPRIFEGSYRDRREGSFGCLDFLGRDFHVEVSTASPTTEDENKDGYPLQHSGESVGAVKEFELKVLQSPIRFVTFLPKRPTHDSN